MWDKPLSQETKPNVDQCLAPFAESRTKLTGETLSWTEQVFRQFVVAGLLFLTKAAGVFEGLRAPCLVNSAYVANSGSRRILYLKMQRWWCSYKLFRWHKQGIRTGAGENVVLRFRGSNMKMMIHQDQDDHSRWWKIMMIDQDDKSRWWRSCRLRSRQQLKIKMID